MADTTLPVAIAATVHTEVPGRVRAHTVGHTVALTFGDDLAGVSLMGRRDDLWRMIGQAGRVLSDLPEDDDR